MMKGLLIFFLSFSLLSAQEPSTPAPQAQSYLVEEQFEGPDGILYYKSEKVEVFGVGDHEQAEVQPQKDLSIEQHPYAERKDFVNNETQSTKAPFVDKRPYAERKDFVSLNEGENNTTIEWIVGKTTTDIRFAVISDQVVAYKTTTYLLALKPKVQETAHLPSSYIV